MILRSKYTISAAVIVQNSQDEILLIRGPRRGREMPGGIVEKGESLTEAAIREVKEETGFDITITRFCGIYQYKDRSICTTLFLGSLIGGTAVKSNESLEVGFFPLQTTLTMVEWRDFHKMIEDSINIEKQPFLVEKNYYD